MKPGSTTTSRKPRKRARNGAIPPHQNRKNSAHNHLRERLRWLSFGMNEGVILEHYVPRGNTVNSVTYTGLLKNHLRPTIKPKRRGLLSTGVLLQNDNARPHTARSVFATIQDLSFEFLPHPPYSPEFSDLTKRCSRRCRIGCALSQKTFFLGVSMHFRRAGTLTWNAMETT